MYSRIAIRATNPYKRGVESPGYGKAYEVTDPLSQDGFQAL